MPKSLENVPAGHGSQRFASLPENAPGAPCRHGILAGLYTRAYTQLVLPRISYALMVYVHRRCSGHAMDGRVLTCVKARICTCARTLPAHSRASMVIVQSWSAILAQPVIRELTLDTNTFIVGICACAQVPRRAHAYEDLE